jgi:hypothetical protein
MPKKPMTEEERSRWFADKEFKRDAKDKALAEETDPMKQRSLRASRDFYKGMIKIGPEGTSDRARKAWDTIRRERP